MWTNRAFLFLLFNSCGLIFFLHFATIFGISVVQHAAECSSWSFYSFLLLRASNNEALIRNSSFKCLTRPSKRYEINTTLKPIRQTPLEHPIPQSSVLYGTRLSLCDNWIVVVIRDNVLAKRVGTSAARGMLAHMKHAACNPWLLIVQLSPHL
ncbi:hypothetical protein FGO68_gene6137 [Halteria grandinella]|uniref:Uncharacterized protein n=1 Tax=Halteria grandinella TaxID=5974 RepID=A0A8J8N960_HALGN|nr:hypothetical protein FGO68_gene6137 [Halteria grandinella]